jgi:hypothetical protein
MMNAGLSLFELRQHLLRHGHCAECVGLENLANGRHCGAFESVQNADARVVDQHGHRTRGFYDSADAFSIGDVKWYDPKTLGPRQDILLR